MTYAKYLKKNIKSCSQVLESIDQAKSILAQLEQIALETTQGNLPDMASVVEKTYSLRQNVDSILVGLVEARLPPNGKQEEA